MSKLNERAMLVNLSIGYWDGRKKDKTTTQEVLVDTHATSDAGVWWTRTVPKDIINRVLAARTAARMVHYRYTMPWANDGPRILPAALFLEYTAAMRGIEQTFRKIVADFIDIYPTILADSKKRLGELANRITMPTVDEVGDKFQWSVRFLPLPDVADFRIDLGSDATADIRAGIEAQVKDATTAAMQDLWTRLHDVVSRMVERLADPKAIFRDSLIQNAAELCGMLPKLNVTGDPQLTATCNEVAAKLAKLDPQTLRDDEKARATAASTATDILSRMTAAMGGANNQPSSELSTAIGERVKKLQPKAAKKGAAKKGSKKQRSVA